MNSLTEISVNVRKGLIFFAILCVAYIILNAIFNAVVSALRKPPPIFVIQPTHDFDKLPQPKFVSSQNTAGINFVLENVEGKPPEATTVAKVYKYPQKIYTNQTIPRAIRFAAQLGFTSTPVEKIKNQYEFTDPSNPARMLYLDIVNLNFKLTYDLTKNPDILLNAFPAERVEIDKQLNKTVSEYFDGNTTSGKSVTDYFILNDTKTQLAPALTKFDTPVAASTNFFKSDFDGLKVVTSNFFKSPVSATYIHTNDEKKGLLSASYTYWPISKDASGLYGLRSSAQAFQDLKDGYGAIISMGTNTPDKIVLRNIYLAYYDSEEFQMYLQPIFVFEGDNNFVAYVPAITPEWLESH